MAFNGASYIKHVAERLIHEFNFSQGAGTPVHVGAAKEGPARTQLERLLPGGIEVGSGIVVDSYGHVSKQQDIVIYESLCPVFAHSDAPEATYYPVEGVIAVGEVKSGLGKVELADAVSKCVSVKNLRRRAEPFDDELGDGPTVSYRNYCMTNSFAAGVSEQFDQSQKSLDQIFSFVLCQKFTSKPNTTLNNFANMCREQEMHLMPNMIVSLQDGNIYPFNSQSNSIARAMFEGDGAIFSEDVIVGFSQLVTTLRRYAISGRTVERKHYELYFRELGSAHPGVTINARMKF